MKVFEESELLITGSGTEPKETGCVTVWNISNMKNI